MKQQDGISNTRLQTNITVLSVGEYVRRGILPLQPVAGEGDYTQSLISSYLEVGDSGVKLRELIEIRRAEYVFGKKLVTEMKSRGELPFSVAFIQRNVNDADTGWKFARFKEDLFKQTFSFLSAHLGFGSDIAGRGKAIGALYKKARELNFVDWDQELRSADEVLGMISELKPRLNEEHQKTAQGLVDNLQDAMDSLEQNSFHMRRYTSRAGMEGEALYYFDRAERGAIFYYGRGLVRGEAPRPRSLTRALAGWSSDDFHHLPIDELSSLRVGLCVEHMMVGGFRAFRVMNSSYDVERYSDMEGENRPPPLAAIESVYDGKAVFAEENISSKGIPLDCATVKRISVTSGQSNSGTIVTTKLDPKFIVAMGSEITARRSGTEDSVIIPKNTAAILLPQSAFLMYSTAQAPQPANVLIIRPIVV